MSGPGGASVWFRWEGLAELVEQLRTLTTDLTTTATPDVEAAARAAMATIVAGYPRRTGDLKDHMAVIMNHDNDRAKAVVINTSPHAVIYERGAQARHTALGAYRGSTPPHPIFSATMIRTRRTLYAQPIPNVLTRFGLKVFGSA